MFGFRKLYSLILILIFGSSYSAFGQTWFCIGKHLCVARSAKDKPFLEAIKKGDRNLIGQFLQKGSDANLKDDCNIPVIYYALSKNRADILKMLIESGAKVNEVDEVFQETPLLRAIDNYESVQILINGGADVNLTGKSEDSPLIKAVLSEDEKITKLLISAGADVNYKNSGERTAYSYAAESGNKELRKILLENGADPTIGVAEYKKEYGENAFFQASADGRTDVVEAMIATGTNVNSSNASKMTALMRAYEDSTIDSLISAGADVNLKDNAGFTALIWAVVFGRNNHVIKLIAAGADVNVQTADGKTALDLATNYETREALIKAGAKINIKTGFEIFE